MPALDEVHHQFPPPSTLAAQIVEHHHHSANHAYTQARDSATFRQLLDEIKSSPSALEQDVQSNYKLISVVAEAGLTSSPSRDPASVGQDIITQTITCLEVCQIAFRRSPSVLFSADQALNNVESQLCFKILPRFLGLAGWDDSLGLDPKIVDTLDVCSQSLCQLPDQWHHVTLLSHVLQTSADEIVEHLLTETDPETFHDFDINFPSSSTFDLLFANSHPPIAARSGQSLKVKSFEQAVRSLHVLIDAQTFLTCHAKTFISWSSTVISKAQLWVAGSISDLWQKLHRRLEASPRCSTQVAETNAFLKVVTSFSKRVLNGPAAKDAARSIAMTLARCLAGILSQRALPDNLEFQKNLKMCAALLLNFSTRFRSVAHWSEKVLAPTLTETLKDDFPRGLSQGETERIFSALLRKVTLQDETADIDIFEAVNESSRDVAECLLDNHLPKSEETSGRPSKKIKISHERSGKYDSPVKRHVLKRLCSILGSWNINEIDGLVESAPVFFSDLEEEGKIEVLRLLGLLPCPSLSTNAATRNEPQTSRCQCAKSGTLSVNHHTRASEWDEKHRNLAYKLLVKLLDQPCLQKSKNLRVWSMIAVECICSHSTASKYLDLNISSAGKWCLQGLRSSAREVRIAAGNALLAFLGPSIHFDERLCRQNRLVALNFLRTLLDCEDQRIHETVLLLLGPVASRCGENEWNLILLQFVDYLGNTNPLLYGLASIELRKLAASSNMSSEEMFRPYWRTIAPAVVKDLLSRPQKAQHLADLLGISVNQLLVITQQDTVPYLVFSRNRMVLERIAQACGHETDLWSQCTQPRVLTNTLALLLSNYAENCEVNAGEHLREMNPDFKNEDFTRLLKVDPISVACEIMKIAADERSDDSGQAIRGFKQLTALLEHKTYSTRQSTTQSRIITLFFENHALGMLAHFSDTIENPAQPVNLKRRCLGGIQRMAQTAKKDISIAVPQIRACLQSALEDQHLCNDAFLSWVTLIHVLPGEEVQSLIGHTITIVVQKWDDLSLDSQQTAQELVTWIFLHHGTFIQDNAPDIPSLGSIPLLAKINSQVSRLKGGVEPFRMFSSFAKRCSDENAMIVLHCLRELLSYLEEHQQWIHDSACSEQPFPSVAELSRSLLDACTRFNDNDHDIAQLCAQCLGIVGCLDPSRVENVREAVEFISLSNLAESSEAVVFAVHTLRSVLVKAFRSASNPRAQGFLAYAMQELLRFCGLSKEILHPYRSQGTQSEVVYQIWVSLAESIKSTLTPFLNSHYVLTTQSAKAPVLKTFPIYNTNLSHGMWLRDLTFDLLQRPKGDNANMIFSVLRRIIRGHDTQIASFLLPYATSNVIIGGTSREADEIRTEMLAVLREPTDGKSQSECEQIKSCSENVFQVLDHLSRWLQLKKKAVTTARSLATRSGRPRNDLEETTDVGQIESVENVISSIPADVVARRAIECGSFSRAILHWEEYIRQKKRRQSNLESDAGSSENEDLYARLQEIYTQINDPDGIEGVSAHLHLLSPEQLVLEHRRAGRWQAAQSWYELRLKESPKSIPLHRDLVNCLSEGGQFNSIIRQVDWVQRWTPEDPQVLSTFAQAAWSVGEWNKLETILDLRSKDLYRRNFNVGIGSAMAAVRIQDLRQFSAIIEELRASVSDGFSSSSTNSLQSCRDLLLKLQALYEMEIVAGRREASQLNDKAALQATLKRRLDAIGSSLPEKQYLLGIRRAMMQLLKDQYSDTDIANVWMTSAKLARKSQNPAVAYDAVMHAAKLGDESTKIEQARLLWIGGEHRKAIKSLEGAIESNTFETTGRSFNSEIGSHSTSMTNASAHENNQQQQNLLVARAHLLLAKWLDQAGQTQSDIIMTRYRQATLAFSRWEKGSYYLGKFYNKLLDSEKVLSPGRQNIRYLNGEMAKLVVENFLRSLMFGCKYLFQTLPKLLTLWLDFGVDIQRSISKEVQDEVRIKAMDSRPKMLEQMNKQIVKYTAKIMAYVTYTALSQMISRISHPNPKVYDVLGSLIIKVVSAHPQQALWSLLAVVKASSPDRSTRGMNLLNKLRDRGKAVRNEGTSIEMRNVVTHGQKLSDELLHACEVHIDGRSSNVSLTKDLRFKDRVAPSPLVVPVESTLTANLPTAATTNAQMKSHKPFPDSRAAVTISSFEDQVLVLTSLQRPRKITVRSSDGNRYGLLCKPNDDLRKDQRLMEFNAMINRSLKKDAEAAKRRLYIKTYAVTPLNEACGLIEWVEGLKPMRDILVALYRSHGVKVDYGLLRELLNEAAATVSTGGDKIFSETILTMYPPILHLWFAELFPAPDAWLAARTRYTRSCAVASMVGHALGLGDRHGENVLLEERDGGVFHVDFNCLFDKGLTFEKPELVPFRLTHNMVDACGATGIEGAWRRSAELAMGVMRGNEDALLTILETFVYDPTADFVGAPRKRVVKGVPDTPKEVLESVRGKVRGLIAGESLPLSVQGHVDALAGMATDPARLCRMYIGWCAFL